MISFVFFLSGAFILYLYIGYPFFCLVIGYFKNRKILQTSVTPQVTLIIAAFNEEAFIEQTLRNKLDLDYPRENLKIIVVSDGSTDRTDEIVHRFESDGVRLIRQEPRAGKTAAINRAVKSATGEILVFSDANSIYDRNALKKLVSNFYDPSVGYVTGKMTYTNKEGKPIGDGCSAYMRYENALRRFESRIGSIVGVDGGIDAVRRSLYDPMRADQLPDLILPLKVVQQGYRVVYEPKAILKEESLNTDSDEYRMRVRVTLRALWAIRDMQDILSVKRHGIFAVQLWSHKVLRYLCFIFLIALFISNLLLYGRHPLYNGFFILQVIGYVAAALYPLMEKYGYAFKLIYFVRYFVLINLAAGQAFFQFVLGCKQITWNPRKGA
jgi:cellulose synthase/poly-beta-1,6-N-acetylglucosamine synthase-like glycosyltransferase